MDWDRIRGTWNQMKGEARTRWGKLTDDELEVVAGEREKLVGLIQERYGLAKDRVEQQVREWQARL